MHSFQYKTIVSALFAGTLIAACGGGGSDSPLPTITPTTAPTATPSNTTLSGVVAVGGPLANAAIVIYDATGKKATATADAQGAYKVDVTGMTAPLVLSAIEAGNSNCTDNSKLLSKCLTAVLGTLNTGTSNTANISTLTDRVASEIAAIIKLSDPKVLGPQQLVDRGTAAGILATDIKTKTDLIRTYILQGLKDAGVANADAYDPVTTPMKADYTGADAVLDVLVHSRGYDNNTGVSTGAMLLDASYSYVGKMDDLSAMEPLNYKTAKAALDKIKDPSYTRILIVGDSTASTYEFGRFPREGWAVELEPLFRTDAKVKVVNNAKSGRSSRNFYNQGYFNQMSQYLRAGDYVIIHHGHNDQNCDSTKASRGPADVATACTYPNDASGKLQYPAGKPEMSFQTSLEVYVKAAKAKGAIPIIMTPTTRFWNASRKEAYKSGDTNPVVPNHFTTQNATNGFAYIGDYSQTIEDTAKSNSIPLIDIEKATIDFANAHSTDWKNYWLAVDPAKYPWYASQTSGTLTAPDTTHFQQAGAIEVAKMVANGIKADASLATLSAKLK